MNIRDRIKELRRVPGSQLKANPKNWRLHSEAQKQAAAAVLGEIGFAGAALARETEQGELLLIDGHMRSDLAGDELVPVLVLDVTAAEADKLLATLDPLQAMAETDAKAPGAKRRPAQAAGRSRRIG